MSALSWIICKTLLEQQPFPMKKELLKFLPDSQVEELQRAALQKSPFSPLSADEILETIHPSWIVRILQPFSENDRGFYLAALTPHLTNQLKKTLPYTKPLPVLTPLGKEYLRQELLEYVKKERGETLSKASLLESPLNVLLTFNASRLSLLAFWLGLHDLTEELRYVIDKSTLSAIETSLSPAEWQAVKTLRTKKERISFGRMNLKTAIETPQKLRLLIEQYGINRLAKALYGENSSLLWHLLLLFDQKRAEFFSKLCKPFAKPDQKEILQQQILALIPLLPEQKMAVL